MKRRTFGVFAAGGMLGVAGVAKSALAAPVASALPAGLTPFGAEQAGNAAGTIPAWTGGMTSVPAGFDWDPEKTLPPDFFAKDAMLYEVNAGNLEKYTHLLSDGVIHLIQKSGFAVQVYPSHRPHAMPEWVYKNIAENLTRAKLDPHGGRFGFSGGYGGAPFPVPDTSQPFNAGPQIVWNHETAWSGHYSTKVLSAWVVQSGDAPVMSSYGKDRFLSPYYNPNGSPHDFDGYIYKFAGKTYGPATKVGDQTCYFASINTLKKPNIAWQLLAGQGRVRKAPEIAYDTPSSFVDGISNYDETNGFSGALNEYNWKCIGKKEILVPYNNNKLFHVSVHDAMGPKFINPDFVRWEWHRVCVVEATLHQGQRNVMARRRLYVDEDTWTVTVFDEWDARGNLYHTGMNTFAIFPNLPGVIRQNNFLYNVQTGDYVMQGSWGNPPLNQPYTFKPFPDSVVEPQAMAAAAAY